MSQYEPVSDEASNELHKSFIRLIFHSADYMAEKQLIDQLTSENKFLNFEPQVLCSDYVAKIRSELSIAALEKKLDKTTA